MFYQYSFLSIDLFPRIYRTFKEAFADYYIDTSYMTEQVFFNRAVKNGVDFESSVGVFDNTNLVAITLIGIDLWKNELSAFDAGTGIIPAYRGKGIAKKMFDFSIPRLKELGAKKFLLEVLQENEPAIKAYRAAGFEVTRELDCFELFIERAHLKKESKLPLEIRGVGKDALSIFQQHIDWEPSWENSFASINRIRNEIVMYGAFVENQNVGLLVYYPVLSWIMSLVTRKDLRRNGIATRLLAHFIDNLNPKTQKVKVVNVDHSDRAMITLLNKTGFELFTNQYEMEFIFETS